jgi:tRNA 2-thiocytidine biosynthesis protein TtcA
MTVESWRNVAAGADMQILCESVSDYNFALLRGPRVCPKRNARRADADARIWTMQATVSTIGKSALRGQPAREAAARTGRSRDRRLRHDRRRRPRDGLPVGGKDSYALLDLLLALRDISPEKFEIVGFNLDQKQPGFPEHVLPEYLRARGVPFHIAEQDTYSVVKRVVPEGKTTCGLCSRLRRGVIYRVASEIGATRIALGHHRDDMLETLFLNMFHGGKMKGMSPKLVSDDGRHIVIRPLAYCHERDLTEFARIRQFPIIPCNLCGSQPNLQRQAVKEMLREWDRKFPGRIENMFRAMQNIVPSHLADGELFDFRNLRTPVDALRRRRYRLRSRAARRRRVGLRTLPFAHALGSSTGFLAAVSGAGQRFRRAILNRTLPRISSSALSRVSSQCAPERCARQRNIWSSGSAQRGSGVWSPELPGITSQRAR